MRPIFIPILILTVLLLPNAAYAHPKLKENKQSIIIEVEGDAHEHAAYVEKYHPFVEVIAVYDKLLNGLALKASPDKLVKMASLDFVKAVHPVQTYKAYDVRQTAFKPNLQADKLHPNLVMPSDLNTTKYTGKGVKVGVIDTGVDYRHPDLENNYAGGYDLVDLDDDPMETLEMEGQPTLHGTHVAGIIAANGKIKGVAPDAEIYAYRALGPGGVGTSVQVIAAMEQAVQDGMDIINLSLGNIVNGPDYPTSIAVNKADEYGIAVVIANGNNGPDHWTVGAPATASNALSVGAAANVEIVPELYEPVHDKIIRPKPMIGSSPWDLQKDYPVTASETKMDGKIVLRKRGETSFYQLARQAEENGAVAVLIANNEAGSFQGSVANDEDGLSIPVASISEKEGEWLLQQSRKQTLHLETTFKQLEQGIASFSSRGPVTVNWQIKPDVIAPGTNILSTIPGGYEALQGTSMASPHVAGAIALLKEAHPDWSNQQIFGALKTTAMRIGQPEGGIFEPIVQGSGMIQPDQAIAAPMIIYDPSLAFGKMGKGSTLKKVEITLENTTDSEQHYAFVTPIKQRGIRWHLPQSFTLGKKEKKTIPIEVHVTPFLLEDGLHQGWLELQQDEKKYHLPYLFVNETADYPKAMGLEFTLKPFSKDEYVYRLYVTEEAELVQIDLYEPDSLIYDRPLLTMEDVSVGMNEGHIDKEALGKPGNYLGLITVQLANGEYESHETEIFIEP